MCENADVLKDYTGTLEQLQLLREETRHEHTQIGQRMNWFVAAQAFLVTPYAIARTSAPHKVEQFWSRVLPTVGIAMSLMIFVGVLAAVFRIRDHRKENKGVKKTNKKTKGSENKGVRSL